MRKILMIAEYFPPAGGVGTFRVTKFVKYLREFDWEPVVLTIKPECYSDTNYPIDHSLEKDIPSDISVYRTSISNLRVFKDAGIRWLLPLFSIISSVVRRERPKLLFATGNPFIPLIVAPFVKKFHGINYVVDFRDPWKLSEKDKPVIGFNKAWMVHIVNHILEPVVINNAHKILCVSEQMAREYREEYPKIPVDDFVVISNGYDPDDFESVEHRKFSQFTIVYTGKFQTGEAFRDPTNFFLALKELRLKKIDIRFVHVGKEEVEVIKIAHMTGVIEQCDFVGHHSYREAISFAKGGDMLLLIGGGQKSEQTGKVFDYIGCRRPILALAKSDTGIGDVLFNTPNAIMIENNETMKIAEAIEDRFLSSEGQCSDSGGALKYHRRALTSELAKILDKVAD